MTAQNFSRFIIYFSTIHCLLVIIADLKLNIKILPVDILKKIPYCVNLTSISVIFIEKEKKRKKACIL